MRRVQVKRVKDEHGLRMTEEEKLEESKSDRKWSVKVKESG
jgi:hypothetical protein